MRKIIILCVTLMMISSIPMAMAAITVDGYKEDGEWNENWAFAQYEASTYSMNGPFGDRLVIRQGLVDPPFNTNEWNDIDPKNDSGPLFGTSMAIYGESSGFDISKIYAYYDPATDTVYGLTEVYGIPGDVDANGDIATVSPFDTIGDSGPAGVGLGNNEFWYLRLSQGDVFSGIELQNNNWEVTENGLTYADIEARFTSNQPNSVYEVSLSNISQHYTIEPGATLTMELTAGAVGDVPGEDTATVILQLPNPKIVIKKYVMDMDGEWQDANTPGASPVLANGSTVQWKYVIENTGDEPLEDVFVTDDIIGLIDSGISLDIGEEMILYADDLVPVACPYLDGNYYVNVGTVEGVGVVSGITVTDSDPAHYVCDKEYVPVLTPTGLLILIGTLGMVGIIGLRRRD